MSVVGCLSGLASVLVISCSVGFKFHRKKCKRLIFYLIIADLIQSIATSSSWMWMEQEAVAGIACTVQGFLLQFGDVSSAFASAVIGTCVFCQVLAFDYPILKIDNKLFEIVSVVITFGGSLLLALIGFIREKPNKPFYAPVGYGAWCWISDEYNLERLMLHYIWIFMICLYLFLTYFLVGFVSCRSKQSVDPSNTAKRAQVIKKVAGFPIVFFVVFVPLGSYRLYQWANPGLLVPPAFIGLAICVFALNGFCNAILYGISRNIFCKVWENLSKVTRSTNV
uniref:G-protein coupled receptors family 1 profile domain-containing protein n=1 Tax=Arcella intermedia TaxID=1963864 RepID=A0A6B2LC25_9EUKA